MNEVATAEINASAVSDAPKKRGNPNWVKKQGDIMKADVVAEGTSTDVWRVRNKDPKMHYVWGRKSNDAEMNEFAQKQYAPARGNEQIMGNPFEATQGTTGKTKERGDRILMCCPNELYEARQRERAGRHVGAVKDARDTARKLTGKGVLVEPIAEETTKRGTMEE